MQYREKMLLKQHWNKVTNRLLDVKPFYCFILEKLWWLDGFIKQNYKLVGWPLEPIVFEWNRNLSQACSDTHTHTCTHNRGSTPQVWCSACKSDQTSGRQVYREYYVKQSTHTLSVLTSEHFHLNFLISNKKKKLSAFCYYTLCSALLTTFTFHII